MLDITTYGKLPRDELLTELTQVVNTLCARIREMGSVTEDFNNAFYPAYAQEPSTSVAAKEKAANYQCLSLLNELQQLEAEIRVLSNARDCILTILPYANP